MSDRRPQPPSKTWKVGPNTWHCDYRGALGERWQCENHLTINSRFLGAQAWRRKMSARHSGRLRSARSPDGNRLSTRNAESPALLMQRRNHGIREWVMSVVGATSENICSFRVFRILTRNGSRTCFIQN